MKYIHTTPLPESSQPTESDNLGQQLAELGILDGDSASVESISSQAADLSLEGQIRWGEEISSMVAAELDELSDASLSQLPLYQRGGGYSNRGYYEIETATVEPLHSNRRDVWQYTLSLKFVGKRGSHFRALECEAWQVDHPWGNTLSPVLVGIPASASKVRWLNKESGDYEPASVVETVPGQHSDTAMYDLEDGESAVGIQNPTLIYDASYPADAGGVRVYDTQGHASKFSNGGDGPRQWQIVHSTEHDISDPVVISNSVLRVRLDEAAAPNITAETWDDSLGAWVSVDAVETDGGNTDWELFDIDLLEVGMSDVRAQLEFEHPSEGLFDLNASLQPGREAVRFHVPDSDTQGPVPSGLESWLSSIAAGWIMDPSPARGLVAREEVRK